MIEPPYAMAPRPGITPNSVWIGNGPDGILGVALAFGDTLQDAKETAEFIIAACNSHKTLMRLATICANLTPPTRDHADMGPGTLSELIALGKRALEQSGVQE